MLPAAAGYQFAGQISSGQDSAPNLDQHASAQESIDLPGRFTFGHQFGGGPDTG
jgi:hypothetical protein